MFISKLKLNNAEGIAKIKREISLAKACLTCKYHATFLENHELSRVAFKSSKYGKHTHNPQFLQSLWRRANARSVSFETIDGGQFTLSTQLIRLKDHIKARLTILDVPLFDSAHSEYIYNRRRVKFGLDDFLDYFLEHFFWTILKEGAHN